MTTTLGTEVESAGERVFHLAIDQLSEHTHGGNEQLTPEDVISLVQDVCIDVRCIPAALPSSLVCIYVDAHARRDAPNYGHANFVTKTLIHDLERAMKVV